MNTANDVRVSTIVQKSFNKFSKSSFGCLSQTCLVARTAIHMVWVYVVLVLMFQQILKTNEVYFFQTFQQKFLMCFVIDTGFGLFPETKE
jgi:hypothetical protein